MKLKLSEEFVNKYKKIKAPFGFNGLGEIVYKRTYSRLKESGENEEWFETVERCINGAQKIGANYTKEEMEELYDLIFNLKCNFPGRMLWQLGTSTVDRYGGNSLLNCWFTTITQPKCFEFIFENLMLGGGVGYSVKREHINELPRIKKGVHITHLSTKDADIIVPDSRQGWVRLLHSVLKSFFETGKSFTYSTILVRGAGEKINGFGGTASGPHILIDGINKIINVFRGREEKKLRSIDVLDICNIIGSIVVAGNVRRSAQISLGDPDDYLFLRAKRWDLGNVPNWRAMSNNTIYADDYSHISRDIWEGYQGNGEPYGFFNLPLSQKYGRLGEERKDNCEGLNPCQPQWAKLLTKNGIRELGDINIGDEIWSETGWTKVINKWSTGVKEVYKFHTTAGTFYGTKNHKIVSNGSKVEVGQAESIDRLAGNFDSTLKLNPQDVMDGLVLGDGTIHHASGDLIGLLIGENDYDYFYSEIASLIIKYRPGITNEFYEIQTDIKPHELLKTFHRSIPKRYFENPAKLAGFLRGLYTANGSICGERVALKTASPSLRNNVQLALSSLGINSYYTTNKPTTIEFSNGEYTCKESYDINITSDRDKFAKIIGFIQKYKQEKLVKLLEKKSKGKVAFDILEVSKISEEEVFDITVDNDTHTYWTEGVNVSNCGEITLADFECCNLAELYLNNISSKEELIRCAILLYKTQKAVSALPFIHDETNHIVHKNMRLGLSVTGVCQALDKVEWLDDCYKTLRKFDKHWSKERGLNESIKLTTIKPSGTVSILAGSCPGVHPAFSEYYIRRIRMASNDKLVSHCRETGYKVEYAINFDGSENHDTVVVEIPCKSSEGAILAKEMTAVRQLDLVKNLQTVWADNAISVTVYYKKEELDSIKVWLKENYKTSLKSVSFLLHSEHGFKQAPYSEINKEQYETILRKIKPLNLTSKTYEDTLDFGECVAGVCPIK